MKIQGLFLIGILLQVTGITSGRAAALWPAVIGLISVIAGWIALRPSTGRVANDRLRAGTAIGLGVIDLVLSIMHLMRTSDGTIGTGSGRLGAIVALALGVIGIILGAWALARSRKNESANVKRGS